MIRTMYPILEREKKKQTFKKQSTLDDNDLIKFRLNDKFSKLDTIAYFCLGGGGGGLNK